MANYASFLGVTGPDALYQEGGKSSVFFSPSRQGGEVEVLRLFFEFSRRLFSPHRLALFGTTEEAAEKSRLKKNRSLSG